MKTAMKKLLCLLLASFTLLLCFSACSSDDKPSSGTEDTPATQGGEDTPSEPAELDLNGYQIIYPIRNKSWQEDTCRQLAALVEKKTGVKLGCMVDKGSKAQAKEILIYETEREAGKGVLPENAQYVIEQVGETIVICGKDEYWTNVAVDRFAGEIVKDGTAKIEGGIHIKETDLPEPVWPVEEGKNYVATCELLFTAIPPEPLYGLYWGQGACKVGDRFYFVEKRYWPDAHESDIIMETDMEGNVLRLSEEMDILQHGNSINYNAKRNALLVAHCQWEYDGMSFIDLDTLELISSHSLGTDFNAIGYNEKNDVYVSAGQHSIDVWNADLEKIASYPPQASGQVPQGGFADDRYLYLPRSAKDDLGPEIYIVDYKVQKGRVAFRIPIDLDPKYEQEDICIVDGVIYLICAHGEILSGSEVFRVTLNEVE